MSPYLVIPAIGLCFVVYTHKLSIDGLEMKHEAVLFIMAEYELALAAKIPEPIKFYTIPGYNCDTTEWKGHCSNLNITQAAYDKDFFKEVGQ